MSLTGRKFKHPSKWMVRAHALVLGFAVLACAVTGAQTFARIYVTAPVAGTGSSGSALSYHPTVDPGWFGDCSDGDLVVSVDYDATRDMYFRNLTINAGKTYHSHSFAVYVCQTLTFGDASSVISNNGNNGANGGFGAVGGAAIPSETLPGGNGGGAGGGAGTCLLSDAGVGAPTTGVNPSPSRFVSSIIAGGAAGSNGNDGGVGQGGGGGGGGSGCATGRAGGSALANTLNATLGDPRQILQGMSGTSLNLTAPWDRTQGGGGGGAGNVNGGTDSGGGGGGGAGWIVVGARDITGAGSISAVGGNGGNGGPTGGGGGAGGSGAQVVVTTETYGWTAVNVSGGVGGSGGGGIGGHGGHGGSGLSTINYVRTP